MSIDLSHVGGTKYFDEIAENFEHRLETEFVHPDFGMVSLKSKHTGIDLPFPLPDAIPAAHATSGGEDLHLVLRPGQGSPRLTIRFARLQPHRTYDVTGASADTLVADTDGRAQLDIVLQARVEIRLAPV